VGYILICRMLLSQLIIWDLINKNLASILSFLPDCTTR
jgi:hypothetical protein